jgi:hypothetical protein
VFIALPALSSAGVLSKTLFNRFRPRARYRLSSQFDQRSITSTSTIEERIPYAEINTLSKLLNCAVLQLVKTDSIFFL